MKKYIILAILVLVFPFNTYAVTKSKVKCPVVQDVKLLAQIDDLNKQILLLKKKNDLLLAENQEFKKDKEIPVIEAPLVEVLVQDPILNKDVYSHPIVFTNRGKNEALINEMYFDFNSPINSLGTITFNVSYGTQLNGNLQAFTGVNRFIFPSTIVIPSGQTKTIYLNTKANNYLTVTKFVGNAIFKI